MMKPLSLNQEGHARSMRLAQIFERFNEDLLQTIPHGTEAQIITMKVEECCYWAQKALALDPRYQVEAVEPASETSTQGQCSLTPIRGL